MSSLLRTAGRVALWVTVGVLLVNGLGAILSPPREGGPPTGAGRAAAADTGSAAFAVRFARAYLSDPSPRALRPLLAEGARIGHGRPPAGSGSLVAQAEVSAIDRLGGGKAVLTVACELRDARTLYLAVPISRSRAGEVAAQGAPWVVAAPDTAGVAAERPRPLAGPEAGAIEALARRFAAAYVTARSAGRLSYLLAPGARIVPLGGALELLARPGAVSQLGEGEGRRRRVVVPVRLGDPASGAVYRLAYRLAVVKRDRWYVRSVEGALS